MIDYEIQDQVASIAIIAMLASLSVLLYRKLFPATDDKSEPEDKINKIDIDENIKIIENAEKIIVSELIEAGRDPCNASDESRVKELREIIAKAQRG